VIGSLIREQLPESERRLTPAEIRTILQRVSKGLSPTSGLPREATVAMAAEAATSTRRREPSGARDVAAKGYSFEQYFADKPQVVLDLYTQLHERIMALSTDVERVLRKQYIGYRMGKSVFCSVIVLKSQLKVVLALDPARAAGHRTARNMQGVGHWGVGDIQVGLGTEDALDEVLPLISEAATAASR